MKPYPWSVAAPRGARCSWLLFGLLACLLGQGCQKPRDPAPSASAPPIVRLTQPQLRDIVRVVSQPSFVESYERTSIYAKVTGYIQKWNVDIGAKVKKGDVLATLFVPELREDWETKKRTVKLDNGRVGLAQKVVKVAEAEVETAEARLQETKDLVAKYKSDAERWELQTSRLQREVNKGVVDPQIVLESKNQFQMATASWKAAESSVAKAKGQLLTARATLEQNRFDIEVARDRVAVAESDAKRLEAWVGYLTLTAPFDGVISARNANTFDFLLPRTGDPSADSRAPYLSPSGQAAPVFVVDRTDVVRIFVDVPEGDANYVKAGTKASVLIRAFRDRWIPAAVTRTSWALNVKSRTLRAEIDLRNTDNPDLYKDLGEHLIAKIPSNNGSRSSPGCTPTPR